LIMEGLFNPAIWNQLILGKINRLGFDVPNLSDSIQKKSHPMG
jgi:hypothetical protein